MPYIDTLCYFPWQKTLSILKYSEQLLQLPINRGIYPQMKQIKLWFIRLEWFHHTMCDTKIDN